MRFCREHDLPGTRFRLFSMVYFCAQWSEACCETTFTRPRVEAVFQPRRSSDQDFLQWSSDQGADSGRHLWIMQRLSQVSLVPQSDLKGQDNPFTDDSRVAFPRP